MYDGISVLLDAFKRIFNEFTRNYNLNEDSFNSGVMAFNTNIIKEQTYLIILKKGIFSKNKLINFLNDETTKVLSLNKNNKLHIFHSGIATTCSRLTKI